MRSIQVFGEEDDSPAGPGRREGFRKRPHCEPAGLSPREILESGRYPERDAPRDRAPSRRQDPRSGRSHPRQPGTRVRNGPFILLGGLLGLGAVICNHVYLFRLKVRTLPRGRCFCRRHEAAVDRHCMPHVRGEVLGSRQPDRLVVFTLQDVLAVFGSKATADYFVALIR
jgi:hypothetical protein